VRSEAPGIVPPEREKMKTEMEALIYHFKISPRAFRRRRASIRRHRVAARRAGCFCGQRRLAQAAARPLPRPSFINLQALPKLIEGQLLADVIACIGTIDIVLGEVDR